MPYIQNIISCWDIENDGVVPGYFHAGIFIDAELVIVKYNGHLLCVV